MSMIPTNTMVGIARPYVILRVIGSIPEMNFSHLINRPEIFPHTCAVSFSATDGYWPKNDGIRIASQILECHRKYSNGRANLWAHDYLLGRAGRPLFKQMDRK